MSLSDGTFFSSLRLWRFPRHFSKSVIHIFIDVLTHEIFEIGHAELLMPVSFARAPYNGYNESCGKFLTGANYVFSAAALTHGRRLNSLRRGLRLIIHAEFVSFFYEDYIDGGRKLMWVIL